MRREYQRRLPALHIVYELANAAACARHLGRTTPGVPEPADQQWAMLAAAGVDADAVRTAILAMWHARIGTPRHLTEHDHRALARAAAPIQPPSVELPPVRSKRTEWYNHWEAGQWRRLKPSAWAREGADPTLLPLLYDVRYTYRYDPPTGVDLPNHSSLELAAEQASKDLHTTIERGVIELQTDIFPEWPAHVPHPEFVTLVNPLGCTGKKGTSEVRPYIDPSITGLNLSMAPLSMRLPTCEALLPHVHPGWVLAKVDWRHGFHHLTLAEIDRRRMGIRLPDGRIARYRGLPFGASQAPAIFQHLSGEYTRLLAARLERMGVRGVVLAIYIDDLLIAAESFEVLGQVREAMYALAEELGVQFKKAKEEGLDSPLQVLEFLGIVLDTTDGEVRAYPSAERCTKITNKWQSIMDAGSCTVELFDEQLGKLAFVASAVRQLRVLLHPLYQERASVGSWDVDPRTTIPVTPALRMAVREVHDFLQADNPLFHLRMFTCRGHNLAPSARRGHALLTDASGDTGYGYCTASSASWGIWQRSELAAPIHVKELMAVVLGLTANLATF